MRRAGAALVLVALLAGPAACEQAWYRSNAAGMLLERIPDWRRDEFEWTVSVDDTGPVLVRRLFEKGSESRRWETSAVEGGARRQEKEIAPDGLQGRRLYDADGTLVVEESYHGGALAERTAFSWSAGRLVQARTTGADGSHLRTDAYLYRRDGSLREVRRTAPAGTADGLRLAWGTTGLAQERNTAGEGLFITRYDSQGRLTGRERRQGESLLSREDFVFRAGSDALESSVETLPGEGRTVRRQYDEAGRLVLETTQGPKDALERTQYTRDAEGRLTTKRRQGPSGLEEWRYVYDGEGRLSGERYWRRGALEKVTTWLGGSRRIEELYAQGAAFLRVTWESGRRVREEVLEDGRVVRERVLE